MNVLLNCIHSFLFKEYLAMIQALSKKSVQENHIDLTFRKHIVCYIFMWKAVISVLEAEWNNRI